MQPRSEVEVGNEPQSHGGVNYSFQLTAQMVLPVRSITNTAGQFHSANRPIYNDKNLRNNRGNKLIL